MTPAVNKWVDVLFSLRTFSNNLSFCFYCSVENIFVVFFIKTAVFTFVKASSKHQQSSSEQKMDQKNIDIGRLASFRLWSGKYEERLKKMYKFCCLSSC